VMETEAYGREVKVLPLCGVEVLRAGVRFVE